MVIKEITASNFDLVGDIYAQGLETGIATFETKVPSWESWDQSHLAYGRIAAYEGEKMLGWASLSPVSSRCVYGGVAEVSVYIAKFARGQGVGLFLLQKLISISEKEGLWTLQSGIFPENKGSIALHKKCGFRMIGFRERIGQRNGKWHDNVIMERRSKLVGVG